MIKKQSRDNQYKKEGLVIILSAFIVFSSILGLAVLVLISFFLILFYGIYRLYHKKR